MAHTILVRLDVDDEYADIHPDITATDYLEGSKAYGWEVVTEPVFTESEVRAIVEAIIKHVEGYYFDRSEIAELVGKQGIVLDPA